MKKPKIHHILKRRRNRPQQSQEPSASNEPLPRITNETVAAHREQVLSSARKYIYPLEHSKHRIVIISISLFIVMIVAFFSYSTFALYRMQSTSTFVYRITQVIPFPIARTGGRLIAYENYLFELRHYMHYYENQQELDFGSDAGQKQLAEYKRRALDKVVDDAYIKQLAERNDVSVSNQEVEDQLTIVRNQNRLGDSEKVFEDVLKEFWGWSVDDFKRSLRQQLLAQKLVAKLDTETDQKARAVLGELEAGADFATMANQHSDDLATKDNGGEFPFVVDRTNPDLTAQTVDALYKLQPGQISKVINIGYALEIAKVIEKNGDKIRAAHILFNFKDINTYLNDFKEKQPAQIYINMPKAETPESEQAPPQP